MWNRWRDARQGARDFEPGKPWLLRFFDQIRFYPVSAEELADIALMAAHEVRRFGVPAKVAFLSHSIFGSSSRPSAVRRCSALRSFSSDALSSATRCPSRRTPMRIASGLFEADGTLVVVREDVGRHNALDKIVGHAFFAGRLPLGGRMLLVSGRVSFEIMQKALAAGVPCVAAISAPTSAAVDFARASGQTLVGFLRGERMNVYAGTLAG